MNETTSILEALMEVSASDLCPMHMPGHKRAEGLPEQLPYAIDITEIDGFDDLHDPQGILKKAMERAAALWKAEESFFVVGGSTAGILAGVRAAAPAASRVLVARNCHKSVYHAVELCGMRPAYLMPEWDESFGVFGSVSPESLRQALETFPDTALVVITSPTYEGVLSDIPALAKLCHARGISLLVDEAHGAHLGFGEDMPPGAVEGGADLVVQSLHKTLPALTQTAIVHRCGPRVQSRRLARELSVFQTSSPSYPLLASIDGCVRILEASARPLFERYADHLRVLSQDLCQLTALRVLGKGWDRGHAAIYCLDPGKVVVSTLGTGWTGPQLAERLRRKYRIEPEMAAQNYVILMTSICDSEENFARLDEALLSIDEEMTAGQRAPQPAPQLPECVYTPAQAIAAKSEAVEEEKAAGRIAAEYLWAYPPGIPLVVPGERIPAQLPGQLRQMRQDGLHLIASGGELPRLCCLVEERK